MPFLALHVVLSFLLDLLYVLSRSDHDQALELLLLRQQLRLYERKASRPQPSRWEKLALSTLAAKLPDLSQVALVFTPATLLRWHREIVKRRWTFDNRPRRGRPPCVGWFAHPRRFLALESPYGEDAGADLQTSQHNSRERMYFAASTALTARSAG